MRNPRIVKALKLRIGERRPNSLIPVLYGSIERYLKNKSAGDLDKAVQKVCTQKRISKNELARVVQNYKSLPHQVKRRWSGEEYGTLMASNTFEKTANIFVNVQEEIKLIRKYLRHGVVTAATSYPAPFPGLQPETSESPIPTLKEKRMCCCCCCCCEAGRERPYEPETPTNSPPEEPPKNKYIWELGPSLYCHDPFEDWLGDDLYAVYAYGDGTGDCKVDIIPKTDGTNDLDKDENGTWPYPERVIYNAKKPGGYLHIEIDIWEKDYTLDFFNGLLDIISAIAGGLGTAIGGAAGGAIGSVVSEGLDAVRSHVTNEDDDNYLGKLVFDYPQGETDLHTFAGARSVDWTSSTEGGVHYKFDFNIRELAP